MSNDPPLENQPSPEAFIGMAQCLHGVGMAPFELGKALPPGIWPDQAWQLLIKALPHNLPAAEALLGYWVVNPPESLDCLDSLTIHYASLTNLLGSLLAAQVASQVASQDDVEAAKLLHQRLKGHRCHTQMLGPSWQREG